MVLVSTPVALVILLDHPLPGCHRLVLCGRHQVLYGSRCYIQRFNNGHTDCSKQPSLFAAKDYDNVLHFML